MDRRSVQYSPITQVYGEVQMDAADLSEHTVLAPTNPYSASKAAAEMYITAYVSSFQLPAIMIRLNNVYGPHQVRRTSTMAHLASMTDQFPVSREFVARDRRFREYHTDDLQKSSQSSSIFCNARSHSGSTATATILEDTSTPETQRTASILFYTKVKSARSTM